MLDLQKRVTCNQPVVLPSLGEEVPVVLKEENLVPPHLGVSKAEKNITHCLVFLSQCMYMYNERNRTLKFEKNFL